ncbi:MAG: segregation/condensation protein A [Candidatus Methanofastidiosia archaeon]
MEIGPIDMLASLVFAKEIDPWNIDIVELTSKYLERMRALKELDLRLSGKTILVAAILLRMQSEEFFREKKEEIQREIEKSDFEPAPIIPPLRRKSSKITLPELLNALLIVLEEQEKKKTKTERIEERQVVRIDVHRVEVKKYVEELYHRILELSKKGMVTFHSLLEDKSSLYVARIFLYLLFLEMMRKIELVQKEGFGEIVIRVL